MIPKIIHYCWFGENKQSDLIKKCLATWNEKLPDYQIRLWSEKDFPALADNLYIKQAYEQKMWAFVSDVFRLYALYKEGGIYLDTDVEIRKSFDEFLNLDFFIGAEKCGKSETIGTAVIGSCPNNEIIGKMLALYQNMEFINSDGSLNTIPNTKRLKSIFTQYNIKNVYTDNKPIKIMPNAYIYSSGLFCLDTPQSYAVHHFEASWNEKWKCKLNWQLPLFGGQRLNLRRVKQINPEFSFDYPPFMIKKIAELNYRQGRKFLLSLEKPKFITNDFINKAESKIRKYRKKYPQSPLTAKIHFGFWLLKDFLTDYQKTNQNTVGNKICTTVKLGGGLGDIVLSLNFLYQFKETFGQSVLLSLALPEPLIENTKIFLNNYDFIEKIIPDTAKPNADLIFDLIRIPVIKYADNEKIKHLNPSLFDWVQNIIAFNQDHPYCSTHGTTADYLTENIALIQKRLRIQQADINNLLHIQTKFKIKPENEQQTLQMFNLKNKKYIALQSGVGNADNNTQGFSTRLWPTANYNKLIKLLKNKFPTYEIIQIGTSDNTPFENIDKNLLGKTDFMQMLVILKNAALFIGNESGPVHFRHFMEQNRSVVIFGPTDKKFYGYPENINLSADICNGCEWLTLQWRQQCLLSEKELPCMTALTPELVINKIEEI